MKTCYKKIKQKKLVKTKKRTNKKKNNTQRNKKSQKRGGGYGKVSCPFVGKPWNGVGPPANRFSPKPWNESNNSNFYAYSKNGIRSGGIEQYHGNTLYNPNKSSYKNHTRKLNNLGFKGGGLNFSNFIPNFVLNLYRPLETALSNNAPFVGKVWQGKEKNVSQLPNEQPNLQDPIYHKSNTKNKNIDNTIDIKSIRDKAIQRVNNIR